ncbi:uncharacterized protein LOC128673369 [Plodia interpunctella]|uniref:uncharacterized protein LOC128673369 n=1 Tax=Plodia interpunctella TaxID=58824 RepID=UPI002368C7B1|nr:uncharacterized protein LOC128673369 [Plodia interpunctella]
MNWFLVKCVLIFIITGTLADELEKQKQSFVGLARIVHIGATAEDIIRALTEEVFKQEEGDREVPRYFERYDTPFANSMTDVFRRKAMEKNGYSSSDALGI